MCLPLLQESQVTLAAALNHSRPRIHQNPSLSLTYINMKRYPPLISRHPPPPSRKQIARQPATSSNRQTYLPTASSTSPSSSLPQQRNPSPSSLYNPVCIHSESPASCAPCHVSLNTLLRSSGIARCILSTLCNLQVLTSEDSFET